MTPARRPRISSRLRSTGLSGGLAALTAIAAAPEAQANAWMRETGRSFLSFSVQSTVNGPDFGNYASLFYEYGLSEKLTLGLDAGRNIATGDTTGIVFLRTPLPLDTGKSVFALELGLGAVDAGGSLTATLRPGLSWGRPYDAPWGNGWLGVDATYARYASGGGLGKIDATFGINHPNGNLTIAQIQFSAPSGGGNTLALAPSHVIKLSERSFLELGAVHEFRNGTTALKAGLWTVF
ncbi:hypothetical protein GCM10011360_37570 [Primorskyibacter flagellatus]|uniref:MetA-pathway of phenol degradation n=1 Tax=Primorskyibacter flagellatus TaxID=1387277 RepID=A0A917AEH7_9RHOB|nr:hypothetical protein [Primorskyibacter flagellatus]GGE46828.1 hypothetical protein GCM10011360_37570 [Primorskyibacter flagellatus]